MIRQIILLNFVLGIMTAPLHATTLEEQSKINAIQQARIAKLESDLLTLQNSLADYLKISTATDTYVTKTAADAKYTTDAAVVSRLKNCGVRLGYSHGNSSTPTLGATNASADWETTALALPYGLGAGDKIYYDLHCFPLIIHWPNIDIDIGTVKGL